MELTKEEREEVLKNLPPDWLTKILKKKKGIGKRQIRRIVREGATDLHNVMPLAIRLATIEIFKNAAAKEDLKQATIELKKALNK